MTPTKDLGKSLGIIVSKSGGLAAIETTTKGGQKAANRRSSCFNFGIRLGTGSGKLWMRINLFQKLAILS